MGRSAEAYTTSLADPVLLDKIDRLFACNVGEYIDLPPLVVVGDQSSGKSSVLEGLTELPSPRDTGLCTRFATQIIFRRNKDLPDRTIEASIIPAPDSDSDRAAQLQQWAEPVTKGLDVRSFEDIMSQVHQIMGLSSTAEPNKPAFSKDVFRLEISGPEEDHLSVIDVPGIFRNHDEGKTTKADIEMVREMVLGYMKNPQSIMLTVIPANVDVATQEILQMARELDANGVRTIGVLTKVDLVEEGAEEKVLDIVNGKTMMLGYGWTVVRNPSQKELQDGKTTREAKEAELWGKKPWREIPSDRFGVASLKLGLQEVVTENARRSFPMVRQEVLRRLKDAKGQLESFGQERETREQQMSFLLDIIGKFQELTTQALNTTYGANELFHEHTELRLATILMNRTSSLSDNLENWGHQYKFKKEASTTKDAAAATPAETAKTGEKRKRTIPTRTLKELPELEDTAPGSTDEESPAQGINSWLQRLYNQSRGFEPGTFNISLLPTAMHKQSEKWPRYAMGYIDDIITAVHTYIVKALQLLCPDRQVVRGLLTAITEGLLAGYQRAVDQVRFVLSVERNGIPMTLNHYFNDNLQRCREQRFKAALADKTQYNSDKVEFVKLADIIIQKDMSNAEYIVKEIHDILESYYKVARKRFVDNIFLQAASDCLINGPETPLKLLSPSFVTQLSQSQLQEIAGRNQHVDTAGPN